MTPSSQVCIARCPEHGLHGERQECFVCGGPVEQVLMAPAEVMGPKLERILLRAQDDVDTLAAERDELRRGGRIRAAISPAEQAEHCAGCGAEDPRHCIDRAWWCDLREFCDVYDLDAGP